MESICLPTFYCFSQIDMRLIEMLEEEGYASTHLTDEHVSHDYELDSRTSHEEHDHAHEHSSHHHHSHSHVMAYTHF